MPNLRKDLSRPLFPEGLKEAWRRRKLVLFLGAGVSQPYGLPGWNDLVLTLLLDESSHAFDRFWPHYRVPLGSWLAETFGLSVVSIARPGNRRVMITKWSLLLRPAERRL